MRRPLSRTVPGRARARRSRSRSGAGCRGGVRNRRSASLTPADGANRLPPPTTASATRCLRDDLNDRTIVLFSVATAAGDGVMAESPFLAARDPRPAGPGEERLEGLSHPCVGAGVVQEPGDVVIGEHGAVEVERELLGVEVGAELAFPDARARRIRDPVQPVLLRLDDEIARRTGPVIELHGRRNERT